MERCLANCAGIAQRAAFTVGEEQLIRVDINCQRKSITVPLTLVLGLDGHLRCAAGKFREPTPNGFFLRKPISGSGTCTSVSATDFAALRCSAVCRRHRPPRFISGLLQKITSSSVTSALYRSSCLGLSREGVRSRDCHPERSEGPWCLPSPPVSQRQAGTRVSRFARDDNRRSVLGARS